MYFEPFKILKRKTPFMGFLCRTANLILAPRVESSYEFKNGVSRFALWDIFSALSLITVFYTLSYIFTGDITHQESINLVIQTNMIFSFGFYTIPVLISFYILIFCGLWLAKGFEKAKIDALCCSMYFARVYALKLIVMIPLFVWVVNLLSRDLISFEQYFYENALKVAALMAAYILSIWWFLLAPLKKHLFPSASILLAYPAVSILIWLSFIMNQYIYSPVKLNFDDVFTCAKVYRSERYQKLPEDKRNYVKDNCDSIL